MGNKEITTRIWADRGTRTQAIRPMKFEWVYLFGAVCPTSGKAHGCLLPYVDTDAMNAYLADFSRNLPPYSPELNPAELLWWQARDKKLSNRAYESIPVLERAVSEAWLSLIEQPDFLRSLCLFPWIQAAISN